MTRPSVILIGPVLPFRGGIAQHTNELLNALEKVSRVRCVSFTTQYPKWLFPGSTDRDPEYSGHLDPRVAYVINPINPRSWKRAVDLTQEFGVDVVVIPWWTIYWAPCFYFVKWALKRRAIRLIFLCHNVIEHESSAWRRWLTREVLRGADSYVVHTLEDRKNLSRMLPSASIEVHPHPIFKNFPPAKDRLARRADLELLFFGFVRPYKGLETLVEAMGPLKGEDIFLTIAGEFWTGEDLTRNRIKSLGLSEQVEIRSFYHSSQETAEVFNRADIVVQPYHSATGSGVVSLAYHYGRPVIATRVGGLPDVVRDNRTGFLIDAGDIDALTQLIRSLTRQTCQSLRPNIESVKAEYTWDRLAETLVRTNAGT